MTLAYVPFGIYFDTILLSTYLHCSQDVQTEIAMSYNISEEIRKFNYKLLPPVTISLKYENTDAPVLFFFHFIITILF